MTRRIDIPDDEFSFKDLSRSNGGTPPPPASVSPPPGFSPAAPLEAAKPPPPPPAKDSSPAPAAPKASSPVPAKPAAKSTDEPPQAKSPERPKSAAAPDEETSRRSFKAPARAESARQLARSNSSPRHQVEAWLAVMVKSDASDLILRAGGRPSQRVNGKISFLPGRVPGPGPLLEVLEGVIGSHRMDSWRKTGSADAAIHLDGLGRFRLNAYKQMGEPAVVIRRIGEDAPVLETLNLPTEHLQDLALRKRGLVLVTGVAGSGKSTTLASMIQYINTNVERHVITLEDPVELLFKEQNCVISQREVGTDTSTFNDGLRHALRQSPDVILIGEVRDAETVVAALEATETGHMVLSTMHTVNAAQSMDRILGFFPSGRHGQIRQRLADNLAGVLSQRLVPRKSGDGMLPAYELMVSTPHIRELLDRGDTSEMARVVEAGGEAGLISFNECLRGLVESQKIELSDALATSDRPEELLLALRGIRQSSDRVKTDEANGPRRSAPPGPDSLRMA